MVRDWNIVTCCCEDVYIRREHVYCIRQAYLLVLSDPALSY